MGREQPHPPPSYFALDLFFARTKRQNPRSSLFCATETLAMQASVNWIELLPASRVHTSLFPREVGEKGNKRSNAHNYIFSSSAGLGHVSRGALFWPMPMDERGNLEFTRQLIEGPLSLRDKNKTINHWFNFVRLTKRKNSIRKNYSIKLDRKSNPQRSYSWSVDVTKWSEKIIRRERIREIFQEFPYDVLGLQSLYVSGWVMSGMSKLCSTHLKNFLGKLLNFAHENDRSRN